MTNREWLESLSDEEFTNEAITHIYFSKFYISSEEEHGKYFLEWLQSEHKE